MGIASAARIQMPDIEITQQDDTREPNIISKHANSILIIFCLLVSATALRLYMLTGQSLWFDEGASLIMTDSLNLFNTWQTLWSIAGGDKYQSLYFLLLAKWRFFVGESEYLLRLLSVIPGILTPVCIFLAVKQIFGSRHALYSALFIVFSSFCVSYSQEVRPYSWLLFLASLQLLCFVPAMTNSNNRPRFLFAAVTLACCAGSILLVVFTIAIAIAHLVTYRNVKVWFRWWIPAVILSTPFLFYYLATPAAMDPASDSTNGIGIPIYQSATFSLFALIAGQTYGPSLDTLRSTESLTALITANAGKFFILALLLTTLAATAALSLRKLWINEHSKRWTIFLVILFFLSFVFAAVVALVTQINWMPRHSFYVILPLCVLLPIGVTYRSNEQAKYLSVSRLAAYALLGLLAVNLYSNINYYHRSEYWRDEYRATANYLKGNMGTDDVSLLLWGESRLLSYYGDTRTQDAWRTQLHNPVLEVIRQVDTGTGKIFIAINREFSWARESHPPRSIQGILAEAYEFESMATFVNFKVYKIRRSESVVSKTAIFSQPVSMTN